MKLPVKSLLLAVLLGLATITATHAQTEEIANMSLEDLMNMEITSVSKKPERLQDVPSSIYVLTADDILKSGATTLHEALRNVPGYWGVQSSYSTVYASIRNSPTVNTDPGTVLYLLDGTPIQDLMGSVFSFENFDIPLDEIDRIEIIRGSGGTIYGANSASGIINIFTKNPENYDGINIRAEGAAPGYGIVTARAGGKITEDLAVSGYAKYRYFSGWDSMAGKDEDGNDTGVVTDFTEDYDKSNYYSLGFKLNYELSDVSKISARVHHNGYQKMIYTSVYDGNYVITNDDSDPIFLNDVNANRTVANLRFDQGFSENHNLFVRVSTNIENDFYRVGGGMDISNAIYDLEMQDNISIGEFNDLIVGANYRFVKFDIHNINSEMNINYIDPQSNENITSAFIQNKVKLLDEKLNFTFGVKAENYSLLNDKYYFSPSAKLSYFFNRFITLWGGFTQAYTTPGFNSTNIDYIFFQTPDDATWDAILRTPVTNSVRKGYYEAVLEQVGDEAIASGLADAYIVSEEGLSVISGVIDDSKTQNKSVKNGSNTAPTRFQNLEIGIKSKVNDILQVNATFFKAYVKDGLAASESEILFDAISITDPERTTDYFFLGNYVKGENTGAEIMLKIHPVKGLLLEASDTWLKSDWEYQENDDFDIGLLADSEVPVERDPFIPEHTFRLRVNYFFDNGLDLAANMITTSRFQTEASYFYGTERYARLEEDLNDLSTVVARNSTRTIVNLRVEKKLMDNKLAVYAFGNDITNQGIIADTDNLRNLTLSQVGAMYGLGLNYKFK